MADTLASALIELQKALPHIPKKADAQYGKYADLADITKRVMPKLAEVGLAFTSRPTLHFGEPGDIKFVLAYELLHVSGESKQGFYPLGTGNPQQLGSAITYARRYCLCAVTGVAPDEDDDDGQEASGYVPETRADGSATEAEQMRMTRGRVPGTERLKATPPDDPFYGIPGANGDATPAEDRPNTASADQIREINIRLGGLGITDRPAKLAWLTTWAGRDIRSSKDLSMTEAAALLRSPDLPAVPAKVKAP